MKTFLQQLADGDLNCMWSDKIEYESMQNVLEIAFPGDDLEWHSRDEDESLWDTMWERLMAGQPSLVKRVLSGRVTRMDGWMLGYYYLGNDEGIMITHHVKSYRIEEEDWWVL